MISVPQSLLFLETSLPLLSSHSIPFYKNRKAPTTLPFSLCIKMLLLLPHSELSLLTSLSRNLGNPLPGSIPVVKSPLPVWNMNSHS